MYLILNNWVVDVYSMESEEDFIQLRERFPNREVGYSRFFSPEIKSAEARHFQLIEELSEETERR